MSETTDRGFITSIRCECDGEMEVVESEATATSGGVCYTVECGTCGETGGYNGSTFQVFGATDRLDVAGGR